jgi:hypothetical protein
MTSRGGRESYSARWKNEDEQTERRTREVFEDPADVARGKEASKSGTARKLAQKDARPALARKH